MRAKPPKLQIPLTVKDTTAYSDHFKFNDQAIRYVRRMTIAGRKITIRKYKNPLLQRRKGIIHGRKPTTTGRIQVLTTDQQYKRRQDNLQRAKNRFENGVHTNYPLNPRPYRAPVEVTLTYATTQLERKIMVRDFQRFIKEMQREYGENENLIWYAVFERQKERGLAEGNAGSWHAHIVFFNLGYNLRCMIHTLWGLGSTSIQRKKYGYEAAKQAAYLSKYFVKDAHEIKKGEKLYLCSHHLLKPEEVVRPFAFEQLASNFYHDGFVKTFISKRYYIPAIDNEMALEVWEPPPQ
jgi:hypothetical protein